jgi:hypothetical protein
MTSSFTDLPLETSFHRRSLHVRRGLMTLFAVIGVLALADVFGQRTSDATSTGAAATVRLTSPGVVRGGLLFESRLVVRARRDIRTPRLVLDRGWTEGMQINSIEPAASSETSEGGRLVLEYDAIRSGQTRTFWLQFQVDPTTTGRRPRGLTLDDGDTPIARIDRDLTILP